MASQEKNKYSLAFKQQVVQEYERGATLATLQRKYGIPAGPTIRRWLSQLSRQKGDQRTMTATDTPTTEVEALQERIAALEKLVAQLSLDKLMLESTVTVLEQRSGEEVKKKNGRRSSARRSSDGASKHSR